ncbi:MAG: DUF3108 domain-containing protein [Myxococcota bacterium]
MSLARFCALVLVVASGHLPAVAQPEGEHPFPGLPLMPVPGLLRPSPSPPPRADEGTPAVVPQAPRVTRGGCPHAPLPLIEEGWAFGTSEQLAFDVTLLGLRTGRVDIHLGPLTEMDGEMAHPLTARAVTSGFLSVLGELDGRMVSWIEPQRVKPVRMVNRFITDSLGTPRTLAREDAAFSVDDKVQGRLAYQEADRPEKVRRTKLKSSSDLVDVLSAVYYMRTRKLTEGAPFCFEIYHRRRLWRVVGEVGGVERVSAPFGTRLARRIEGRLHLIGDKAPPREVRAFVSDDRERLPLLVETPDKLGALRVQLKTYRGGLPSTEGP